MGMTAVSGAALTAIWLVETEIAFSVEEQDFIGTTAGQMTRRAFLSSRVIQAHGKLSTRWRVKNDS